MAYAQNTTVSVEKSRAEIERVLERYGAKQFRYGRDDERGLAIVEFSANERHVRFVLRLPNRTEKRFQLSKRGARTPEATLREWEQACRQKWRALLLTVKAKLEAVEAGISVFEDEFLAHIVLPSQETVGDWLRPQIAEAYLSEEMPTRLLALPAPSADR
jgi:hypothetical protein